jgi:tRNA nucleotidyltransferase (CCA-adding enzyme)
MTRAVAVVPARLPIRAAARLARRRRLTLLVARLGVGWGGVTPETLVHALRLDLGEVPVRAILWRCAGVAHDAPEVAVRRRLGPGRPFVTVLEGGALAGAVLADPDAPGSLPLNVARSLDTLPGPVPAILRQAGTLASTRGWPIALVGGVTRDLLGGRPGRDRLDLDVAVQGDAPVLARELSAVLGGLGEAPRVRIHPAFRTATLELPRGLHVDLTTARQETYRAPGALPTVEPSTLENDLWRRDFALNAVAVRLDGPRWGEVLDPTGGLADLRARRLRVLHPLAFVEDPTRLFRVARYGLRLGARLDPATRHLAVEATRRPIYEALSDDRLRRELRLIREEPEPERTLVLAGRLGVLRLGGATYRFPAQGDARLRAVRRTAEALAVSDATRAVLELLALSGHLSPARAAGWIARLGGGPAAEAAGRARTEAPGLQALLAQARPPESAWRALRRAPELSVAWAHLTARRAVVRNRLEAVRRRDRELPTLVRGEDLIAAGLPAGPAVGAGLEGIRIAQLTGRLHTRAAALAWARRRSRRGEGRSGASVTVPGTRGG